MKVAIVCDWLLGTGGAERVVLELHRMYPDAPIYTSQYDPNPKLWYGDKWFEDADIRTTWLQKLPKSLKKFLPPLRALAFSRLNLSDYDLVISSSGAEAKFVKARLHIAYVHAPTHYYWARYDEYMQSPGFGKLDWLARIGLKILVGPMRRWDHKAAQRPDYLVANSNYTKNQINKFYGREAVVIHPPVDVKRFNQPTANHQLSARHGFVTAGRLTPYKRMDLPVKAATMHNMPLAVIGRGPERRKLKRIAGRSVTFLSRVSDTEVARHFAESKAFIFPGIDDFGIVAVEAMAAGTPVIAYKAGGALDYVNKDTGMFFEEPTAESLAKTMEAVNKKSFNHAKIARHAAKFSPQVFQKAMSGLVESALKSR